jgi:hypothetical protein
MHPTVLIARMLDIASSSPDGRLIGGGGVGFDSFDRHTIVAWRRFMGAGRKPMWLEPVSETDTGEATRGKRSAPGAAKHAHGEAVIRMSIARNETNDGGAQPRIGNRQPYAGQICVREITHPLISRYVKFLSLICGTRPYRRFSVVLSTGSSHAYQPCTPLLIATHLKPIC